MADAESLEDRILQEHNRRFEDRDRMLNTRLDTLEKDYADLSHQVSALENKIIVVGLEQGHLKDLLSARLSLMEKTSELQISKIDQLSKDIQTMGADTEKTPMGRTLRGNIHSVQASVDEHTDTLKELTVWKDRVEGVLTILKWIGAGGLIALGISVLRLIKVLP